VTGVIVAARPAPGVTPAQPGRDFFVGTVGPSDFAPFEVTVAVDPSAAGSGTASGAGTDTGTGPAGDAIDLPVRVTYRDGGVPETVDATVEYRPVVDERASVSPTVLAVGLGLIALGALALVVRRRGWRWGRRDRPDDPEAGASEAVARPPSADGSATPSGADAAVGSDGPSGRPPPTAGGAVGDGGPVPADGSGVGAGPDAGLGAASPREDAR
jgi:hypothetical protein